MSFLFPWPLEAAPAIALAAGLLGYGMRFFGLPLLPAPPWQRAELRAVAFLADALWLVREHGHGVTLRGQGINVTLGLPIIRTSVDHGTALDLAGKGLADSGSLVTAINHAIKMVEKKRYEQ